MIWEWNARDEHTRGAGLCQEHELRSVPCPRLASEQQKSEWLALKHPLWGRKILTPFTVQIFLHFVWCRVKERVCRTLQHVLQHCAGSRSCVREGNQRGPGQMFPFTNAAKEQGMLSSLPWCYLHFTTSSNNHATSSLGKEKTMQPRSFIIVFIKRAKIKLFLFQFWNFTCFHFANETGHKYFKPHPLWDNYQPLPFSTWFLLGYQTWLTVPPLSHTDIFFPFSKINWFLN